jgi:hypothetical protein
MGKENLILVPSTRMDGNKKPDRDERGLIRMSKAARNFMGYQNLVEVWPQGATAQQRTQNSVLLEIFHAFSADIKELKADGFTKDELKRVGFVTTDTYKKITGKTTGKERNIWIADKIHETVLGTDPEFLLFDNDRNIIHACNVMGFNGEIGCDGAMAEIRPKPAMTPEDVVRNIETIFKSGSQVDKIKNYDWVAGCYFKNTSRDFSDWRPYSHWHSKRCSKNEAARTRASFQVHEQDSRRACSFTNDEIRWR